ncbi:TetR/AcrR family transcriptional regulator [Alkalilacustris brevis]|uniref:TetR/AcrR family transcriptional regulator n=1 Tax=Alkalilacustris brevis TaxID=2026338 RepID=UPI000E0D5A10|nr:TetR/AcrR family transcriptional regulator [Alkalilacustris brevis]
MPRRRKPAEDRKAEIIDACLALADRLGPGRMTTNHVAQAVGVTQAAIFRHFPSKQALWLAVAESVSARLAKAWERAVASDAPAEERLKALLRAQFEQISATPALPAILFSRELNIDNPELRETFRLRLMGFQAHIIALLEEMRRTGGLRDDLVPADAAVHLTSLVQGLAIRWTLGARSFCLPEEGLRLLDTLLALMRSPKGRD